MKNILIPFVGDTIGGSHISDVELMQAVGQGDFSVVYLLHKAGALKQYLEDRDIIPDIQGDLYVPRSLQDLLSNLGRYIVSIKKASVYLKTQKIDAVYCSDGPLRYVWFYAAKLAKVRFVLTQHALSSSSLEKKISYRLLDGLVVNSTFMKAHLPVPLKDNRLVISYPIVQLHSENKKTDLLGPKDVFRIGFVANMRHVKRPYVFLDMAKQLIKKYQNMHFYMVGECYGDEHKNITNYIQNEGLEKYVSLIGFQDYIHATMKQFDLIVAPAVGEAFGRVPVEAALLNVPVVAAKAGGHEEVIIDGKTGLLAEPDNVADFVRNVERLHQDKDLYKAIQKQAYEHVKNKFAFAEQAIKVRMLLDAIL